MDRLTGHVSAALEPPPAAGTTRSANDCAAIGRGYRCETSAPPGRRAVHRHGDAWLACVGVPYRAEGTFDATALVGLPAVAVEEELADAGGEFALACYAPGEPELLLATDRFASIPLYYAASGIGLVFGTDLDWVVGQLEPRPAIDPQALYDYLFFSVVPGNRTVYQGVHKLPAASLLAFSAGRIRLARYWRPDFGRSDGSGADLGEQTFEAISRSVGRVTRQPDFGCFLSGGLDSSTVAGLAAKHSTATVNAFTIGFDVPDFDESRYARISARHFGLSLHEKRIRSADVSACIDVVTGGFSEPFGNASAVSTYLCARFAREAGITRLLAGDGGDELFGGNDRYQKQRVFNLYGELPGPVRALVVDPLAAVSRIAGGPARKLWSYVDQARVPLPDRLFSYNLLVRNDPSEVLTGEFLRRIEPRSPYDYARSIYGAPAHGDALDRMLYLDWALTLTDNDLPKVRVACALAGIAVHFPMLDPAVIELSTRVPSDEKLTLRELRKFYKETFRGFLPAEVIGKQKHGFGVPVGIWINEDAELRDRVHSRLHTLGQRHIVRPEFIADLLRRQQTEHATYYGALTWWLFMLEEWLLAHGG